MKKLLLILILLNNVALLGNDHSAKIKETAETMIEYYLDGNYEKYSEFVYPKLIEMFGGKETFIKTAQKETEALLNDNFKLIDIEILNPQKIYPAENELHCLVPQNLMFESPNGKLLLETYLIAISKNNGNNWYFIDIANFNKENIKNILPNYNENMILPLKTPLQKL
jgi:hypothetical protein